MEPLLSVTNLTVEMHDGGATARTVLDGVSFSIAAGEAVGLVGESGCGKTTTALALLRLLPAAAQVTKGSVRLGGRDLLALWEKQLEKVRGAALSMVFQDPAIALNPVMRAGDQVAEVIRAHRPLRGERLRQEVESLFERVWFSDPARIYAAYPHELSGGQRQRVAIAQALACQPRLLIADEPTAALDTTVQSEILDLLKQLKAQLRMAMLIITHNPAILAGLADRVLVMNEGRLVEEGAVTEVYGNPSHRYTKLLLGCASRESETLTAARKRRSGDTRCARWGCWNCMEDASRGNLKERGSLLPLRGAVGWSGVSTAEGALPQDAISSGSTVRASVWSGSKLARSEVALAPSLRSPLVEVRGLSKRYLQGRWYSTERFSIRAVDDVNLAIPEGSCVALVGESGSGKSTLARCLAALERPTEGEVWFEGRDLLSLGRGELFDARQKIQLIFQDAAAALNPRLSAVDIIAEPLEIHHKGTKGQRRYRALELMEEVGLRARDAGRRPLEFSGGQRQRLAIARALALEPKFLILDEAFSALDLPLREQIVDLLGELREARSLTYLYISHDLALVSRLADHLIVMQCGRVVEQGCPGALFRNPQHPHTQALVNAIPVMERNWAPLKSAEHASVSLG